MRPCAPGPLADRRQHRPAHRAPARQRVERRGRLGDAEQLARRLGARGPQRPDASLAARRAAVFGLDLVRLSLGKVGVRALTTMLAEQYGSLGIHVATVTVCGTVAPGTEFDPDRVAEHYWRLHRQGPDEWEQEVVFAGSRSTPPELREP